MIPKEKAKLLIYDFWNITGNFHLSKKCALIAVDEILNWHLEFLFISKDSVGHLYWEEVKQEIENL